jgi:hypothetical protein
VKYVPLFIVPGKVEIVTQDQRMKQVNEFNQKLSKLMTDYRIWSIFAQITPDD